MRKYIDTSALTYLWQKIKALFVSKSGDTMTGNLTIHNSGNSWLALRSTGNSSDIGVDIPTDSTHYPSGFYQEDEDGYDFYYSEAAKTTTDSIYKSFVLRRRNAAHTQTYYNGFYLWVENDGTPVVTFSNTTARDAWLKGLGFDTTEVSISHGAAVANVVSYGSTWVAVARKSGKTVQLQINGDIRILTAGTTSFTLLTLPEGYRPSRTFYMIRMLQNGTRLIVGVGSGGGMTIQNVSGAAMSSTSFFRDNISFVIK